MKYKGKTKILNSSSSNQKVTNYKRPIYIVMKLRHVVQKFL